MNYQKQLEKHCRQFNLIKPTYRIQLDNFVPLWRAQVSIGHLYRLTDCQLFATQDQAAESIAKQVYQNLILEDPVSLINKTTYSTGVFIDLENQGHGFSRLLNQIKRQPLVQVHLYLSQMNFQYLDLIYHYPPSEFLIYHDQSLPTPDETSIKLIYDLGFYLGQQKYQQYMVFTRSDFSSSLAKIISSYRNHIQADLSIYRNL